MSARRFIRPDESSWQLDEISGLRARESAKAKSNAEVSVRGKDGKNQGMNWIRQEKRLAIYLRDGLACIWCNFALEDGAQLSLDHVLPYSEGGSNEAGNLVTACFKCNSSRGDRSVSDFAAAVAGYVDLTARSIIERIIDQLDKPLDINEAKAIIARRREEKNAAV